MSILGQEDLSKIILTINGKPIILDNQSSRLSIVVKDYDIIQIIGNDLNAPSKVRIDGVTKNIILPEVGLEIDIDNRIQLLTKVRLK